MTTIETIEQIVGALASIVGEPDRTLQQRPERYARAKEAIQAGRDLLAELDKQHGQSNFCPQCEALGRELKAIKEHGDAVATIRRNEFDEYRLEPRENFDVQSLPIGVDVTLFKSPQTIHENGELVQQQQPTSPDVRDALLFCLFHHQGSGSKIGQPIRHALGIHKDARLTDVQVEAAMRVQTALGSTSSDEQTSCFSPNCEALSRDLDALKAQASQDPVFWYRPIGNDGGYDGPLHNSVIEQVRKLSGVWVPLIPKNAELGKQTDAHKDAERYRWLFNNVDLGAIKTAFDSQKPPPVNLHSQIVEQIIGFYTAKEDVDAMIDAAMATKGTRDE
jgi:hypothetical protein